MAKVQFNVDAYTAKLIGRENVASLDGAIQELVKNTYDADASVCFLYYEKKTNSLYIGDNGLGMTEEIIKNHWMTIGKSSKKNTYTTKSGRVQTGAKGIGRFALDRIADKCTLLTKTKNTSLYWSVDWSDFEFGRNITEITADLMSTHDDFTDFLSRIENDSLYQLIEKNFLSTGSIFKLSELRDEWAPTLINNIRKSLTSLIPYEFKEVFNIYLFEEETARNEATILQDVESDWYDYKIHFEVSELGEVKIEIYRDEFDFADKFSKVMSEAGFSKEEQKYFMKQPKVFSMDFLSILGKNTAGKIYNLGHFSGNLYFAKKTSNKKEQEKYYYKNVIGRKDFSELFGGIRIYRDGFRVRPYGDPTTSAFDWLMLARRRNQSPAGVGSPGLWRVSSDQLHGNIYISRMNVMLPDQSNREGIIETDEFKELKLFLEYAIKLFEQDRQSVCRKLGAYYVETHETEEIEEKAQKYKNTSSAKQKDEQVSLAKVADLVEKKDIEIQDLKDELKMLSALATTGIITNTYVHEIRAQTHKLQLKTNKAEEYIERGEIEKALARVKDLQEINKFFNSWFKVTVDSIKRDKRKMRKILIDSVFTNLINAWQCVIPEVEINYHSEIEDLKFRCFSFELESIINNLIANSNASFKNNYIKNKTITLEVQPTQDEIIINYSDSGVGLSDKYKKNPLSILEPFETSKLSAEGERIGTGMGMWIVHRIVQSYNGKIDLSKNIKSNSGFYIEITLPIK